MKLTDPMFERVNVPPVKSSGVSLPASPIWWSLLSSTVISNIDLFCTFFTFGTTKPCCVSMATPMLCEPWQMGSKCSIH